MNKMILILIMIILLVALLSNHKQGCKRYEALKQEAKLIVKEKNNRFYEFCNRLPGVLLIGIATYMMIGCIVGQLHGNILLISILIYLVSYYILEYTPYTEWSVIERGILIKRQLMTMNWENIVDYGWVIRDKQLILKIKYKGKGIVIRKGELIVPKEQKAFLEKILKEKLPYLQPTLGDELQESK